MSDISLYLDQDNELKFNVSIEGSKLGTPKYRLVFEGKDFSCTFAGQQAATGEIVFAVPAMKNVLKEGEYRAELEVLVGDRYFVPLQFGAGFESSIKVVAESVAKPAVKSMAVTASIVGMPRVNATQPEAPTPVYAPIKEVAHVATIQEVPVAVPEVKAPVQKKVVKTQIKEAKASSSAGMSLEELRDLIRLSLT